MNTMAILAQSAIPGTLVHWIIIAIILAGVVGIAMVALRQSGITIPPFIITIMWIVLVVVISIAAIKLILSMV